MAILRTEARKQIEQALRRNGIPDSTIGTILYNLNLPPRLGETELQRYLDRAVAQGNDYVRIASGVDPRVHTGSGISTNISLLPPGDTQTTAEKASSALDESLVGPFRAAGWPDPDQWARRFYSLVDQYVGDGVDETWMAGTVDLIEATASRFGKNPELGWQFFKGNFSPPPPDLDVVTAPAQVADDGYGLGTGLFSGWGGGGGGAAAPVYIPPDRRDVEDMVRGQLARLVGRAENSRLQTLTDLYMTEHRRSWDSPELGLNPAASVTEQIRSQSDFKRIHNLRPDFVDEDEWVTMAQSAGISSGLTAQAAEQFAINQATVGTRATSLGAAAATTGFAQGQKTPEFVQRAKQAATNVLRGAR